MQFFFVSNLREGDIKTMEKGKREGLIKVPPRRMGREKKQNATCLTRKLKNYKYKKRIKTKHTNVTLT